MDNGIKVKIGGEDFYYVPAVCKSATVGMQSERFLTVDMDIKGDGWGTGGPGICLDTYDESKKKRIGTAYGCEFIRNVLEAMGVDSYAAIVNRPIDVIYSEPSAWGHVMKGFRCRKMHGGNGEWMVFANVFDPEDK